jgi:DNA (cytosine-5)-methyltransferase 1
MFTVGSLFSGIGGFDLGLERAGMSVRWQVEIDPYCNRVLAKHWPDVPRYRDVRDCGAGNLAPVDLVCGGVPCQPASVAGKRRGTSDDRWLWPEATRIIRELRPAWCLFENVPGLLSLEHGTIFDSLLADLEAEGYACGTLLLPAVAFDAPHRRMRVWIVANANSRGLPESRVCEEQPGRAEAVGASEVVADSQNPDGRGPDGTDNARRGHSQTGRCGVASGRVQHWSAEPAVGRVADGVLHRVDRLRTLGNAVVPQVAQWLGERILEAQ